MKPYIPLRENKEPVIIVETADPIDVAALSLPFTLNVRIPWLREVVISFSAGFGMPTAAVIILTFPFRPIRGGVPDLLLSLIPYALFLSLVFCISRLIERVRYYYFSQITATTEGLVKQRWLRSSLAIPWESLRSWEVIVNQSRFYVHTVTGDEFAYRWTEARNGRRMRQGDAQLGEPPTKSVRGCCTR